MKKQTNSVVVNPIAQSITISKAYYKRACTYGTVEYYEFRTILSENAGFSIEFKVIEKKTYKSLTFERMAEYIKTQPNSEKQLITFAAVQRIAEKKGSKYPLTKKWFLNAYPEYKENEVSANETAELEKQLEAQLNAQLDALMDDDTDDTLVEFPNVANL